MTSSQVCVVSRLVDDDVVAVDGAAASEGLLMVQSRHVQGRQRLQDDRVAPGRREVVWRLVEDDVAAVGAASCMGDVGQRHVPSVAPDVKGVDQA